MNFIVTQIKKSSLVQYSLADRTVQFICIPDFEIYTSFIPDIMHICDLGLFVYIINFIMEMIGRESQAEKKIQILNDRLSLIPRYYKLSLPSKGINNRTNFTANNWRIL